MMLRKLSKCGRFECTNQCVLNTQTNRFSIEAYAAFATVLEKAQPKATSAKLKSSQAIFEGFVANHMHKSLSDAEINNISSACVSIIQENSQPVSYFSTGKQKTFAVTLRDFDAAMRPIGQGYFLAAGTALGAIRDGQFIPHDEDIDIGLFHTKTTTKASVEALIGALSQKFVHFQTLGAVDHGLELRLIHKTTKVHVDMNWFYESADKEPFLWCATYFGDAEARKFQKYRYKHSMFSPRAIKFAEGTYSVPPKQFLEEYYGKDWETPKRFDYWQGLAGEYKNIISE